MGWRQDGKGRKLSRQRGYYQAQSSGPSIQTKSGGTQSRQTVCLLSPQVQHTSATNFAPPTFRSSASLTRAKASGWGARPARLANTKRARAGSLCEKPCSLKSMPAPPSHLAGG